MSLAVIYKYNQNTTSWWELTVVTLTAKTHTGMSRLTETDYSVLVLICVYVK